MYKDVQKCSRKSKKFKNGHKRANMFKNMLAKMSKNVQKCLNMCKQCVSLTSRNTFEVSYPIFTRVVDPSWYVSPILHIFSNIPSFDDFTFVRCQHHLAQIFVDPTEDEISILKKVTLQSTRLNSFFVFLMKISSCCSVIR